MVFYKYAGSSGIKILEDLRLKISPPNEFNDPFEFTPRSKITNIDYEMLNRLRNEPESFRGCYYNMVKIERYPHTFERFLEDLRNEIPCKSKEIRKLYRKAQMHNDLQSIAEASHYFGILCVSKVKDSIPMWSHYADHHRGIVMGLDFSHACFDLAGIPGQVKYQSRRCPIDRSLRPPNPEWYRQLGAVMFIKSRDWTYEQEYRQVFRLEDLIYSKPDKIGKRHYFLNIDGDVIREIIFGCYTDITYENRIRAELLRRPKTFGHVKLFQCKRHNSRFALEILPA